MLVRITRRNLLAATATAGLSATAMQAQKFPPRNYIELTYYWCRNSADGQMQRVTDFLKEGMAPAADKAGVKGHGYFGQLVAPKGPFVMSIMGFPSFAGIEDVKRKLFSDPALLKAIGKLNATPGLGFTRVESRLMRGFPTFPEIQTPKAGESSRVFELRTYESNNFTTLGGKIGMFDNGEIDIFRKVGMTPIFFGETIYGGDMPNLTYMLAYDSLAHREKTWSAFVSDPDWAKLRATPGLSDAEVVSNISSTFLRPLPFSPIR